MKSGQSDFLCSSDVLTRCCDQSAMHNKVDTVKLTVLTKRMARKKFPESVRSRKRDDILDVAMSVFENQGGLEALSFRTLASEMKLSYSAPYRYFSSKDELINALRARAFRWIEREMLDAIADSSEPELQLEALAEAFIRSGLKHPHRYALMFFNLNHEDSVPQSLELKTAKREALDVCTRVIAEGQRRGNFPVAIDPLTAAHLFWAGAHGLVSLQVAGQFVMGRNIRELVPSMIHALRMGMDHFGDASILPAKVAIKTTKARKKT